jgi:hypothetical protein
LSDNDDEEEEGELSKESMEEGNGNYRENQNDPGGGVTICKY